MDGTTNGLSASDIALLGNDGGGMNGFGSFFWVFALLILAGGGFGGFGSNNTSESIQKAVDLNSIQQGQASISADLQRGIYEINNNTNHQAYDNLGEIRDVESAVSTGNANIINNLTAISSQMQNCCCTTQRAIDSVNYNLATQSAAIQANDTSNTQKILDALSTNRMADMQNQINALQLQNAVAGVVRYPMSTAYCSGNNPFSSCNC